MTAAALEIRDLRKNFGALQVASDVDLALPRGARRALIGPNGAGKTTLVNLITGVLKASSGRVLLNGEDITSLSQAARTRRGLARTFQINQLFRGLSVLENVCLAISERDGTRNNLWRAAGGETRRYRGGAGSSQFAARWSRMTRSSWCANCLMAASAWWKSPSRWRNGRTCCCSTNPPPACRHRKAISSSTCRRSSIPISPC